MSFQWWRKALKDTSRIGSAELPIHESDPQPGYYRKRNGKGGPWQHVAIWTEEDRVLCLVNGAQAPVEEVWTWCCRHPIAYELYVAVAERGEAWPDSIDEMVPAVLAKAEELWPGAEVIGHNQAPPAEMALDELKALEQAIADWLKKIGSAVSSEEQDAQGKGWQERLSAKAKEIEESHKAEKAPFLEGGRRVDAAWRPAKERAEEVKRRLSALLTPYRVERDRKRREAEEAARAALASVGAAPPPAPVRTVAKGFRTVKVCVVADPLAAVTFLLQGTPDEDLLDAIRKASGLRLKAGIQVPGAELIEEARA